MLLAFGVWVLKEAYQAFIGSGRETQRKLDASYSKILVLEADLKHASEEIKTLRLRVDLLVTERREYRR